MPAVFEKLDRIKPFYDVVYKFTAVVCKLLLIADILIVAFQVAGRYVPFIPDPSWTEQVVLTLMSYMAVLSAALAIRRGAHIRMTAFDAYLPKKVILASDVLADLAVMALGVALVVYGIKFCNSPLSIRGKYASLPNLSKVWQYLPVPVAGAGMIIFELEQLFLHIEAFFVKEGNET